MKEMNNMKKMILVFLFIIFILVIGILVYNNYKNANIENNSDVINKNEILSDDESLILAQKTLNKYAQLEKYENSSIGPMPGILEELGLETAEQIEQEINGITDSSTYIKSRTKYNDFKEEMLKYVTEDYFNNYYSQYKNIDDYVTFYNCAGGVPAVSYQDIVFVKRNGQSYEFTAKLRDEEVYEHYVAGDDIGDIPYESSYTIVFEYMNDNLVISNINPK